MDSKYRFHLESTWTPSCLEWVAYVAWDEIVRYLKQLDISRNPRGHNSGSSNLHSKMYVHT